MSSHSTLFIMDTLTHHYTQKYSRQTHRQTDGSIDWWFLSIPDFQSVWINSHQLSEEVFHCDCNVCVWPGKQLTGQVDAVSPSTWTRWPCVTSDLVLYLQRPSPPVCLVGFVLDQTDQLHFFHQSLFVSAPFFKAYQVSFNFILCSPAFHPFFLGSLHPNINNQPCTKVIN